MSDISGYSISFDIGYKTPWFPWKLQIRSGILNNRITYELGRIDREPDYNKVILSLLEANQLRLQIIHRHIQRI
jgi:hypothetical protein